MHASWWSDRPVREVQPSEGVVLALVATTAVLFALVLLWARTGPLEAVEPQTPREVCEARGYGPEWPEEVCAWQVPE